MPRLSLVFAVATATQLAACASGPPSIVHVTLRAASDLNPDTVGLPNPVQAHVYLLRTSDTFSNTDYFQLADHERAILGPDLLASREVTVRPGQSQDVAIPVVPETKIVAITAAFRNIDAGTWRATTPLHGTILATLGAQTVQIVESK